MKMMLPKTRLHAFSFERIETMWSSFCWILHFINFNMVVNISVENNSETEILRQIELLTSGLDAFFLASSGAIVLFMHAGFACLESGSVRAKNTTNILIKNTADLCFGKTP